MKFIQLILLVLLPYLSFAKSQYAFYEVKDNVEYTYIIKVNDEGEYLFTIREVFADLILNRVLSTGKVKRDSSGLSFTGQSLAFQYKYNSDSSEFIPIKTFDFLIDKNFRYEVYKEDVHQKFGKMKTCGNYDFKAGSGSTSKIALGEYSPYSRDIYNNQYSGYWFVFLENEYKFYYRHMLLFKGNWHQKRDQIHLNSNLFENIILKHNSLGLEIREFINEYPNCQFNFLK